MKTILSALMLVLSLQAFGGELVVYDAPTSDYGYNTDIKKSFGINNELGRAWVVLTFTSSYDEGTDSVDQRVLLPGLGFNKSMNQIVLNVAGEEVACATTKTNFFGTRIKPTGLCTFTTKYYKVKRDNGYEMETIEKVKVTLNY